MLIFGIARAHLTVQPKPGYHWRKNLGGQIWKPSLLPSISFNLKDAMRQNVCTGAHPVTIQSPSGNNSNHPRGNNNNGPYTKNVLHFKE